MTTAAFTPVTFTKGGATEIAYSPEDYYQYVWEGWHAGGPPPAVPRSQLAAHLSDLDSVEAKIPSAASFASTFAALPKASDLVKPVILGHRGGGGLASPDGTLESMRFFAGYGYPAMDCGDFRSTLDKGAVCMHDATLDRTTTLSGNVSDFTLAAVTNGNKVDASSWFGGGWQDAKVPTWGQIVGEFGRKIVLFPEAKDDASAQAIANTISAMKLGKSVVVASFDIPKITPAIAAGAEGMHVSPDGSTNAASLLAQGIRYVCVDHTAVSLATVDALAAAGLKVYVYVITRQLEMARYDGHNVEGFYCEDPLYSSRNYSAYRKLVAPWTKSGTYYPGHISATAAVDANRGQFVGAAGAYRWQPTLDGFVLQGWGCPVANAAASYSITVPITWDTAGSDATRWVGVHLGQPTDLAYNNSAAATDNGYLVMMRQNGTLQLYKEVNGASTSLGTAATPALTSGATATVRIDVTPTTVTATRTDVGTPNSVTTSDTAGGRGGYFYLGKNGTASGLVASFGAVTIS